MDTVKATYNPICEMREYDAKRMSPYRSMRVIGPKSSLEEAGMGIIEARPAGEKDILLAHTPDYVEKIKNEDFGFFDKMLSYLGQIPASEGIHDVACASAGCAVSALDAVEAGEADMCFALTQPPGHHAGPSNAGGFCVYNNAAIAAKKAAKEYGKRVAILDIDVHDGNGTREIVRGDESIFFATVNVKPMYPLFSGWCNQGNCRVYGALCPPLFIVDKEAYFGLVDLALEDISKFEPELLVVSAGFDTYRHDLKKADLLEKDYAKIGEKIAALDMPTITVLEGGYAIDKLPELVANYCAGFRFATTA